MRELCECSIAGLGVREGRRWHTETTPTQLNSLYSEMVLSLFHLRTAEERAVRGETNTQNTRMQSSVQIFT